jgi:6-phosphofructokinase 2
MTAVVTFTPNPALDLLTHIDRVSPTHKMRCSAVIKHPGGGGVNVARVLHRFGIGVTAVYPSGGVIGQAHHRLLHAEGVRSHVIAMDAETRESFSVHEAQSGEDFRFVLPGPQLSPAQWQACWDYLCQHWPRQFLVLSGGLAPGMPEDAYAQLVRAAHAAQVPVVLDANGPALALALKAGGVALFKPSMSELRSLTGAGLQDASQCVAAARGLIQAGQAQRVAVSLGPQGALLVTAQGAWRAPALAVPVQTTIGAGDSFVGGMVYGLCQGMSDAEAFRWGMAASAAALLSPGTPLCQWHDCQRLLPDVTVQDC